MGNDRVTSIDNTGVIAAFVEHTHVNTQVVCQIYGAGHSALKERKAKRVVVCATFGLFTNGLEKFDEFFAKGYLDCVVTTNLNYHTPELLKRDWYVEADMSKFIAAIINSLNHNVSLENALTPTAKIQKLIKRYNEGQM